MLKTVFFGHKSAAALVFAALIFAAVTSLATDGRYREYIIGERAGGMGGAAIAVARDVDAVFYNPAGLASAEHNVISLSANLYGVERYTEKNGIEWGEDDSSSSFVSIPGAMGGVRRLTDELVGGFGVFSPKHEKRHIVASFENNSRFYYYDYDDQTLWLGPAIAWKPAGSRFSFGAGIFGVYRDYGVSQSFWEEDGNALNGTCDLKTFGLLASLGVQVDMGDGWRAGTTLQTPNLRVWDDGTYSATVMLESLERGGGVYSEDVEADNYIPWQLGVGIGRTIPGEWGFGLDATYHNRTSYDFMRWNFSGERFEQSLHLHSVVDLSLGGEYVIAGRYPLRAGVYTAFSSIHVPDSSDSNDLSTSDVDMYGTTFSIGRRGDNIGINLGFDCAFGHGHDLGYGENGEQIRTACNRRVFLATVSTTFYF